MTKSTITRERLAKIKSWRETYGAGSNVMLPAEEAEELARMALAAMDSEPDCKERKLFCSTDTTRMRKTISVSAGTEDAPLYRHAQQPVVSADLLHTAASAIEDLLTTKDRTGAGVWFDLPFRLRSAANAQPAPVVPDGYVMVPKVPSQAHLNSIAMRYRHDFYLLNDAQKDSALATARQMYEECSGQGFYTLPAAPQEVK